MSARSVQVAPPAAQKRVAVLVRFQGGPLDAIEAAARAGYRTRNAEIVRHLEAAFVDEHGVIVVPSSPRRK